jgi:hypothetical protein
MDGDVTFYMMFVESELFLVMMFCSRGLLVVLQREIPSPYKKENTKLSSWTIEVTDPNVTELAPASTHVSYIISRPIIIQQLHVRGGLASPLRDI